MENNIASLNITDSQKKEIQKYLGNLKTYVMQHDIDIEVYNDIEEMFYDKLSNIEKIDDLQIKKAIKEVGKAEDIFGEFLSGETEAKSEIKNTFFYDSLIQNGWVRDNSGAIILGVSKTFAQKLGIPTWIFRIFLLILIFAFGISVWFYIIAGIILPVKSYSYGKRNVISYISLQIILACKNSIHNITLFLVGGIGILFKMIQPIFRFIKNNIFPIIRFVFFSIVSVIFLSILMGIIIVGAFYFSDFSLGYVQFFAQFPWYFIFSIISGIVAFGIFTLGSLLYGWSGKNLNSYILIGGGISFLFTIFFTLSTGINLIQAYIGENHFVQNTSFQTADFETGIINLDISGLYPNNIDSIYYSNNGIDIIPSNGPDIQIKIEKNILGNEKISKKIEENLNTIHFFQEDNTIHIGFQNNHFFKNFVPFTIINNDITLYLPQDKIYYIDDYRAHINVFTAEKYGVYNKFINSTCYQKEFYYSNDENAFVCDANEDDLANAKLEYLREKIVQDFDNISPLQHIDAYKNTYYGVYGLESDWSFDSIYLVGDDQININFSDKSLEINAQLKYTEDGTGFIFSDFKVVNVITNYAYKEKYYTDTSSIEKFIEQSNL